MSNPVKRGRRVGGKVTVPKRNAAAGVSLAGQRTSVLLSQECGALSEKMPLGVLWAAAFRGCPSALWEE